MIDKQFFDTFGIKPKKGCIAYDKFTEEEADAICNDKCAECSYLDDVYPQITDRILLKLICIVLNTFQTFEVYRIMDIDSLKEKILKLLMLAKNEVYSEVRTLFKGV